MVNYYINNKASYIKQLILTLTTLQTNYTCTYLTTIFSITNENIKSRYMLITDITSILRLEVSKKEYS